MTIPMLYGATTHPDSPRSRELVRHLVENDDHGRTLCGHRVRFLFDYATPLAPDCRRCGTAARARDAAVRRPAA